MMKRIASLLTLTLLLAASAGAQARKIETIPNTNADNELAYLDLLAKALGDNPSSRGFLIGYRKSDLPPGAFLRHLYGYVDYLVNMRGIVANRVAVIEGNIKPDTFTEMWVVPAGAAPPIADSNLNLIRGVPLKFDTVFPDCPSEMSVYLEGLTHSLRFYARALTSNQNVFAKIVAYRGRRATVRKVARIASQARTQLITQHRIDGNRIATVARNQSRDCSQIELWLIGHR
jgi:hypothetical protein